MEYSLNVQEHSFHGNGCMEMPIFDNSLNSTTDYKFAHFGEYLINWGRKWSKLLQHEYSLPETENHVILESPPERMGIFVQNVTQTKPPQKGVRFAIAALWNKRKSSFWADFWADLRSWHFLLHKLVWKYCQLLLKSKTTQAFLFSNLILFG